MNRAGLLVDAWLCVSLSFPRFKRVAREISRVHNAQAIFCAGASTKHPSAIIPRNPNTNACLFPVQPPWLRRTLL